MRAKLCPGMTRRDALRVGVLGGLGLSMADYLRLAAASETRPKADAAIYVALDGGPAHLDTLDMKPDAPSAERGEFGMIDTSIPGLAVCEHMPNFARIANRFALIRGISHSAGDHQLAKKYVYSGNAPSAAIQYPAYGSVLMNERPVAPDLPPFVGVPMTEMDPGFMGVAFSAMKTTRVPEAGKPFEVRGLSLEPGLTLADVRMRERLLADLDVRFREADAQSDMLDAMDRFGRTAQEMILSPRARTAFDTSREPESIRRLFSGDELNQSLLLAVRLVEHGVRFVTINNGAWDTHLDNFTRLKNELLPPLDRGLAALIAALDAKGLLERTLVIVTGEFGRTPTINKNAGRDHWPRAMWSLFAGGPVRQGALIGGTDAKGHGPDDATALKPDDLGASIYAALGVDPKKEYHTSTGRPVMLVSHGEVIEGLFA